MKSLQSGAVLFLMVVAACNESNFKGSSDRINPTVTREFSQDALPAVQQTYRQGYRGQPQLENFDQGEWGALDLLVVVDNSRSMAEEQANLATKLNPLLSKVQKSDWQIAVITTDGRPGRGDDCPRAIIKKSDADAAQRFQQAVIGAGIDGDGVERGISQAVRGLNCASQPWVRPGSTVAVLILADEDNCHIGDADDNNYGCVGEAGRFGEHLTDYLASIRTPGKDARVYGLIWHPTQTQAECSTALNRGHEYAKVIQATSGKWGSICDADYTPTLQAISADIGQILKYEYELSSEPDRASLEVLVDGEKWEKYEIEGKLVKFTEPPPFGSKVEIGYRFGKDGELVGDVKLDKPAAPGTFKVIVEGEELAEDAYSYDEASGKIVFKTPPPERAEVEILYKEKVELQRVYSIGKNVDPRTLVVTVDGKRVTGFRYDEATGELTLDEAPPPEAKILVSFKGLL